MAEVLEEPVRSEHEVDVNVQTENETMLEEEIALTRDFPVNDVAPSVFAEFIEPKVNEIRAPAPVEEKAAHVNVEEVTEKILEAVDTGNSYYELLRALPREQFHEVIQKVNETVRESIVKDAHSEGQMTPEKMRRAEYIINHSAKIFDTEDETLLNYMIDIEVTLGLQTLDSGRKDNNNNASSSIVMSLKGEEKLVSTIVEDLTKQLSKDEFEPEKVKGRIEYLLERLTEDQRNSFPDSTKSFLLEYEREQNLDYMIAVEDAGYFVSSGFHELQAEEKGYILQSMKEEISVFLEKEAGDVKRVESQARILLRATTEEERKNWPEALREYVEAPHHDYTELPQDEQFERIYKDITNSYLTAPEFRSHMAKLPGDIQEKLLDKILEDSTAYSEGRIGGSAYQSGRLKNGLILMDILHKDADEIVKFRNKLEFDLAKGHMDFAKRFDSETNGELPYGGVRSRIESILTDMNNVNNPEAKKIYLDYIQNYELGLIGNTEELERQLKNLKVQDQLLSSIAQEPSTLLLRDRETTMKEYLLKQEGVEERKDGSLFVQDTEGILYDIESSYSKYTDGTEAWYIKVTSQKDPLTFKMLEMEEFQEKMKNGGIAQMIIDAKQSRRDEVTNKDVLVRYDLPMDEKTTVIRAFPSTPDDLIATELNHGHHMATALRARYGEAVDVQPITFGKDMMLKQIDEAYRNGSRSFFVNAYGHGGKHGEWSEGIHLDDGQFKAEDIQKLLEKYPDAHFIVATDGCHGGGLAAGVEVFMKDKPELVQRLILMTQTKPDIVGYLGQLGGTYEATFIKSIYNGATFGEAIRNADIENKKQRSIDADTIIHGIKVGDIRPVRAEDLMA